MTNTNYEQFVLIISEMVLNHLANKGVRTGFPIMFIPSEFNNYMTPMDLREHLRNNPVEDDQLGFYFVGKAS